MSGRRNGIPIAPKHLLLPRSMALVCMCAMGANCGGVALSAESDMPHEQTVDFTRATVIHAAGAIQLSVPANWHVLERPVGREIRLWLTPAEPNEQLKLPRDGLSVTYRYNADRLRRDQQQLQRAAQTQLDSLMHGRVVAADPRFTDDVKDHRAVRVDFIIPETRSAQPGGERQGFFLLVETQWGDCELCAASPRQKYSERQAELEGIVRSLRLQQPTLTQRSIASHVRDAEQIIGSWKAYRSRMTLMAGGRMIIQTDRAETVSTGWPTKAGHEITGRFTAKGDVLLITWDDDSKLNFRWRLHKGRLLLTDHEGRTSHLSRILTIAEVNDQD